MLFTNEGLRALIGYAEKTIFYHYDGWPDDPVDEHSSHPLLCREASVMTDLSCYGPEASGFLEALGLLAEDRIQVSTRGWLSSNEIESATEELGRTLTKSTISLFYPIEEIANGMRSFKTAPEFHQFVAWNGKQTSRRLMTELGIPMPIGLSVDSREDISDFVSQTPGPWIMKSHLQRPIVTVEEFAAESLVDISPRTWTIEQILETPLLAPSPNLTWLISENPEEDPIFLFAADQRIESDSFSHKGNRFPSSVSSALVEACASLASPVLDGLRGIDSVVGIDFIFDADWNPVIVDINPRFNSCTFPGLAFERLSNGVPRVGVYSTVATSAFSTLSEILAMCRDTVKWFSPTDQRGMILFGPQVENSMCAFRYLCIGIDDDDCEEIIARFLESAGVAKEQIDAL